MHVRTLTGQAVSISQQIDQLHTMTVNGSHTLAGNVAYARRLGRQIAAACGGPALRAVLEELKLFLCADHHTHLGTLWVPIAAQADGDTKDYRPVEHESVAFDLTWGPGAYSRCEQAMVAAMGRNRVRISRVTIPQMQAQGIRAALAEAFLVLAQEPKRIAS